MKAVLIIVAIVVAILIIVGLYCCLVVASRADDAMERDYKRYLETHPDVKDN